MKMLKGIDISNWQKGLIPHEMGIDFCIVKATEGLGYVDPCCDGFVQDCIKHDIKWGFYHFARENNPESEAQFFYDNCKNYFNNGIPVLDYETNNANDVEWCERFISELYDLSGVWCLIYISASKCGMFEGSWIPDNCGLWVAGYPMNYTEWTNNEMPYNIYPFKFAAIWQFTSSLNINGWSVDGDYAYMDKTAWDKYAQCSNDNSKQTTINDKTCEQLADEVIAGKWGNGWNRKNALDSAYGKGTYEHVQTIVNMKMGLDGC